MVKSKLRGHDIVLVGGEWLYADTKTPTAGNERGCGYCGKVNTEEGHDGCLGTLPNAMNACCGHGQGSEAYIQYPGCQEDIRGADAIKVMGLAFNEFSNQTRKLTRGFDIGLKP